MKSRDVFAMASPNSTIASPSIRSRSITRHLPRHEDKRPAARQHTPNGNKPPATQPQTNLVVVCVGALHEKTEKTEKKTEEMAQKKTEKTPQKLTEKKEKKTDTKGVG